jgi:hypothetical protein
VDKRITSPMMIALRDNPIAIAEADATVALNLLPTVLLGTMTTTSGASKSLTGLVLTPFKNLMFVFDAVSSTSATFFFVGASSATISTTAAGNSVDGIFHVNLATGVGAGASQSIGISGGAAGNTGYSTATTTVTCAPNAGTFDAGQIKVYGLK